MNIRTTRRPFWTRFSLYKLHFYFITKRNSITFLNFYCFILNLNVNTVIKWNKESKKYSFKFNSKNIVKSKKYEKGSKWPVSWYSVKPSPKTHIWEDNGRAERKNWYQLRQHSYILYSPVQAGLMAPSHCTISKCIVQRVKIKHDFSLLFRICSWDSRNNLVIRTVMEITY